MSGGESVSVTWEGVRTGYCHGKVGVGEPDWWSGDGGGEEVGEARPREKMGTTSRAGVHGALHTGHEGWEASH